MTAAPIFLSIPAFVVGIPVAFVKARLAAVMPTARLREKLSPGILVFVITIIYLTVQHIQFFYDTIRCLTLLYNINLEKVNTKMFFEFKSISNFSMIGLLANSNLTLCKLPGKGNKQQ